MAAGLGFKDFTTGEVLTAADVDGYLMQGVWVFASAAARDAAVTSPQEGNFAYLKDTNVTTYYTGSAWANLDTTGMTNPMTTTGDIIYSSSGSTPARLGIGSTGDVLTVAGGVPSWAAASSGALTLVKRASFSGVANTGTTFDDVFSSTYASYQIVIETIVNDGGGGIDYLGLQLRYAGPTTQTTGYFGPTISAVYDSATIANAQNSNIGYVQIVTAGGGAAVIASGTITVNRRTSSAIPIISGVTMNRSGGRVCIPGAYNTTARDYTGFLLLPSSGNITGTVSVYGLATA